jgi:hypothetical protein
VLVLIQRPLDIIKLQAEVLASKAEMVLSPSASVAPNRLDGFGIGSPTRYECVVERRQALLGLVELFIQGLDRFIEGCVR